MLISTTQVLNIVSVVRVELYHIDSNIMVRANIIYESLIVLKNHYNFQFKILTSISGVDLPRNLHRFQIVYELLSVKYNARLRVKTVINELIPVNSIEKIYSAATWLESEIWDMFGVFFSGQSNLTRLLTDYGFQGHPLRKDFPLTGFLESRFNLIKNRVVYENLELAQEYRIFEYISPWEVRA